MKDNKGTSEKKPRGLKLLVWSVMAVAAVAVSIFLLTQNEQATPDYFKDGRETAVFIRTVDGDTAWFEMGGEKYKVRFLGVDSPELDTEDGDLKPYAEQAAKFVTDTLKNATIIFLEADPKSDEYDNYDRLLCWVWADGELLNAELVANGLADVRYIYGDYMYVDELYEMRASARKEGIGMWR